MSIDLELKKEGIEIIKPLDTISTISVAKNVATKLVASFGKHNLSYNSLFIKLSKLNMYIAKFPVGSSHAKYYYKNSSIYFSDEIDFSKFDSYAVHECIHHLQELRDEKNNLLRLGLCDFTSSKLPGMALNEASVQLISSKALNEKVDKVKYFDITFPTNSPYYYSLECNLVSQMAYLVGEDILFDSTLNSNDNFKTAFIDITSKSCFNKIQKKLEELMGLEEILSMEASRLGHNDISIDYIVSIQKNISVLRNRINTLFITTQNLILTSYFDSTFKSIKSVEKIQSYRQKLYNYKDLIGITDNYTFFNDYYVLKMSDLEKKEYTLNGGIELSLTPLKRGLFSILFSKLASIFRINKESTYMQKETDLL